MARAAQTQLAGPLIPPGSTVLLFVATGVLLVLDMFN
ncbi:hypothetical protein MELE44368_00110 [Mycolicibacterium elephantis DSM 44368]|uniref:Uncharacterized protein n=1 Tax=Mycolicibacterium elephantis DSM 44368 TaxID=1335622 RepID=A0A439DZR0_9MYCO|nr:hypothetical protein MELE44368_00110 [Mycolicibacterium elephantis DSM 44368]